MCRGSAPPLDLTPPRLPVKDPLRLSLLPGQAADGIDVPLGAEAEGLLQGLLNDVARHPGLDVDSDVSRTVDLIDDDLVAGPVIAA